MHIDVSLAVLHPLHLKQSRVTEIPISKSLHLLRLACQGSVKEREMDGSYTPLDELFVVYRIKVKASSSTLTSMTAMCDCCTV